MIKEVRTEPYCLHGNTRLKCAQCLEQAHQNNIAQAKFNAINQKFKMPRKFSVPKFKEDKK